MQDSEGEEGALAEGRGGELKHVVHGGLLYAYDPASGKSQAYAGT